jgi:membrane-associated protease RseP (regulator of RpoE activity)
VAVERGGNTLQLSLRVPASAKSDDFDLSDAGISPQYLPGPIEVAEVQPGMPAEEAGLRGGDAIAAVDGQAFHSVNTLLAYMQAGKGKTLTLTVLRNGATLQITATPTKLDTRWMLGFAPRPVPIRDEPLSLVSAAGKSWLLQEQFAACGRGAEPAVYAPAFSNADDGAGGNCEGGRRSCRD